MKIQKITIGGCVPFPQAINLEWPTEKIVAIVGDNGAGKSTLLDSLYIALYGDTTKPGGIYSLFNTKHGIVEVDFSYNGHDFKIKRLIDGVARTQKVWVYQDDLVLTEGKARQANEAVENYIGITEGVFLASVYNAQTQKGNPLEMGDRQRRDLLSQVIGLSAFDEPLAAVRDVLSVETQTLNRIESDLLVLQEIDGEIIGYEKQLDATKELLASESKAKDGLEVELEEETQKLADLKAQNVNGDEISTNITRLNNAISDNKSRIANLNERINNNKNVLLAQEVEIKAAAENLANTNMEIRACEGKYHEASTQKQNHSNALNSLEINKLNKTHEIKEAENKLNQTRSKITLYKGFLEQPRLDVPCNREGVYASCPLISKDIKEVNEANEQIPILEAELKEVEAQIVNLNDELNQIKKDHDFLSIEFVDCCRFCAEIETEISDLKTNAKEYSKLSEYLPQLELAESAIEQYESQIKQLDDKTKNEQVELDRWENRREASKNHFGALSTVSDNISRLKSLIMSLNESIQVSNASIGSYQAKLEDLREKLNKRTELDLQKEKTLAKINDFTILKNALGPKGAPALKIDAAGPAISELANTLLAECYGNRFTISIKTQKSLSTDESELRECLEFSVIDHENGEESNVDQKSGGEQQLIREVISLALCIYQRKQTNIDIKTIIRDEACSALTEANAERYIKMLDKACEIGELDQVVFVSHHTIAHGLADKTINLPIGS